MSSTFESLSYSYDLGSPEEAAVMGPEERWFSIAAGACLAAYGLSRLRLGALLALGVGAYSVYRGSTGRCMLREKLAERQQGGAGRSAGSWGQRLEGTWAGDDAARPSGGTSPTAAPAEERALRKVDCVDEAAMESFPASDPPSYTGATAAPTVPIQ